MDPDTHNVMVNLATNNTDKEARYSYWQNPVNKRSTPAKSATILTSRDMLFGWFFMKFTRNLSCYSPFVS